MDLFRVEWEYTALAMNDIQLAVPTLWISFMARAVYSNKTLNAIQYYINIDFWFSRSYTLSFLLHERNLL